MAVGTEVGLGAEDCVRRGPNSSPSPRKDHSHILSDRDPGPDALKGHSPQFSANVRCGQTAGWIKVPLDYCNSLYYNLPKSQITRLQQIQNSLARVVVKTPKCCHITPILHSLHWLKIT